VLPGDQPGLVDGGQYIDESINPRKVYTDTTPWADFTPTVTPSTGTLPPPLVLIGRYKHIGKTVSFNMLLILGQIGTAGGILRLSVPIPALHSVPITVLNASYLIGFVGWLNAGASEMGLCGNAGNSPLVSDTVYYIAGQYESS
jgi:hypothetical protein